MKANLMESKGKFKEEISDTSIPMAIPQILPLYQQAF